MRPDARGLLLLLAAQTLLLGWNAWRTSPTLNEPAHLVAGLIHWNHADFSYYRVNPPLVRCVATIPVQFLPHRFEDSRDAMHGSRPEVEMGNRLVAMNGAQAAVLFAAARWATLSWNWIGAVTCYLWARHLYGSWAGLMAAGLWCVSPMVLGHGALITADAPAAAMGTAACYLFWRWLEAPDWGRAALCGVVLGLAQLCKFTLLIFYPLWPLLWLFVQWVRDGRGSLGRTGYREESRMLGAILVLSLLVLNLGYLGQGTLVSLGDYSFESHLLAGRSAAGFTGSSFPGGNRFRGSWLEGVPVPLPYDYVLGIDRQQVDFESYQADSYLNGVFRRGGWWHYYLSAAMVKTPIGELGLAILAGVSWWAGAARGSRASTSALGTAFVALNALAPFVVVSCQTGFSAHYRYAFPCLPLVWILLSRSACELPALFGRPPISAGWSRPALRGGLAGICFAATAVSSFAAYPHSLSYFNEFRGGPRYGANSLLGSNLDWGQDLFFLRDWVRQNARDEPVYLAWDGFMDPHAFELPGIDQWPMENRSQPGSGAARAPVGPPMQYPRGLYAISENLLSWSRDGIRLSYDSRIRIDGALLRGLRRLQPFGTAGYSVRIFTSDQLNRVVESAERVEVEPM